MKDNEDILSHKPINKITGKSELYKHNHKTVLYNSGNGDLFTIRSNK